MKRRWNVVCQVCDREMKSDQIKFRWDGLIVCPNDWEPRHPLDYMRTPKTREGKLPFTSPEKPGIDGSPSYILIYVDDSWVAPGYFEEL